MDVQAADDEAPSPTAVPDGDGAAVTVEGSSRWQELRSFWIVAGVLLVLLLGLIPVIGNGSVAVPDDGVYAAQAALLSHGSWSDRRPAAEIDSHGLNSAIRPDFVYRDRQIPYLKHPLFPLILAGFYKVGGFSALIVFSVLGVWLAAVAAGLIARRIDPRYGIPALALTGVCSPLLFDAYLISAHGMAAALFGIVALGVAMVVDDRRWWPLVFTLPCGAVLVGLRTEATVGMLALSAVVALMAVHPGQRPRLDRRAVFAGGCVAVVTVAAYLADAWWSRSIKESAASGAQPLFRGVTSHRDPLAAAWVSLVRPWAGDARSAQTAIVLAVAAVIVAAVSVRVAPSRWLLPALLTVLSAGCLVYQNFVTPVLLTGLIGAFPLMVAGLILLRRGDLGDAMVVRHLAVAALTIVVITLTTYEVGGAIEWGGRFYHLLVPLLVPLVVLGLHHGWRALPPRPGKVVAAAVAVGALALSTLMIQEHRWLRAITRTTTTAAREFALEHPHATEPDGRPLVVVGLLTPDGSARMFWEPADAVDPVTAVGLPDLFRMVTRAQQHGYPAVTLVTDIPLAGLATIGNRSLKAIGWGIADVRTVHGTPFGLVRLAPTDRAG